MRKPIIPITLAYLAGLLLGHLFLYFPSSTTILITLGIAASLMLVRLDRLSLRRLSLVAVSCAVGMLAYLYSAAWFPSDHLTRLIPSDTDQHGITGVIVSPLDRDPDRTAWIMELRDVDGIRVAGKARLSVRAEMPSVGYGDTIVVTGKLYEPHGFNNPGGFDYAAYLARSNIHRLVFVKDPGGITVLRRGTGIFRTIQDWRERIRQSFLSSTGGPGAAILMAMTLGEEGRLTDDLRDRFQAAGVTHIISISGSHLGMVAILCFGLIRGLLFLMPVRWYHSLTLHADPKKIAAWLTLPLVIFYTLLAGGQVATVRSLVMIAAGLLALILDREHALIHSLALAALFILIATPQAVFDISFQLSYISILVIGFVVSLWNELGFRSETFFQKIRNGAALLIVISLATGLATGPLVAHYFNQFSYAGIVSNLVVVPFAGMVVVPLGLFSGIVSLFTGRLPLPELNQFVSDSFIGTVAFFSRLPFAESHPPSPGIAWLGIYALFLVSLAAHLRERLLAHYQPLTASKRLSKTPVFGMALFGALLALLLIPRFLPNRTTEISFPDVGQGDCALIQLSSGKTVLIDGGGTYDNRFDIGRRVVAPYLWNKGIRAIDLVILSHPHTDHVNGLKFIVKAFTVAQVWESGRDEDSPGYAEFERIVTEKKIPRKTVAAGDAPVSLGGAEFLVLHPARDFIGDSRSEHVSENNRSLVVRMACDGLVSLFPGDIEAKAEQRLIETVRDLKCDLVKVPHHGGKSSSGDDFVALTQPDVAVITVGKGNRYRHPSEEVIERFEKRGTHVYRTDADGAVTVRLRGNRLETARWKDRTLERIELRDRAAWGAREWANGSRLLIRATAF